MDWITFFVGLGIGIVVGVGVVSTLALLLGDK